MLGVFNSSLEVKLLLGFSITVLYITYYLVEVVKKPLLVCRAGEFRQLLESHVPLLSEPYWPTPWCVEARLQTVVGSLLRSALLPHHSYTRQVVKLSDGGQVALDWLQTGAADGAAGAAGAAGAVMLVLPGLAGGAHADYVRALAGSARSLGARLVVFNQRGLGGLPLTTPKLYCALSHDDLAEVVGAVVARCGAGVSLLCVGVSLGGLILGNYLAAHAAVAALHVRAALIVSSPLDVVKGAEHMERPVLNALLSAHMARRLRSTVAGAGLAGAAGGAGGAGSDVRGARTLRQFDAAFTVAHFGFPSVEEYYSAASLTHKLAAVRVPLLCLCAADDPFQPLDALPVREAGASSHVALAVTARGGHIGFLQGAWPAAPTNQYIATLATQYFRALLHRHAP